MKLEFQRIEYNSPDYRQAVKLRSRVLREPLKMKFSEKELESEKDFIHLAVFQQNRLAGCLYLVRDNETVRLRQFVIEPELQNKGIGRAFLQYMESYCRDQGINYIYMYARESAVPFYQKLGYKKYGGKFLEIGLPHWKLHKWL